ncbi:MULTISPECIES: hypothetical protein [unclassified Rhizobium]|uniref:hypothetical protein n=1 Tax=unclassified Rhizobium TaxID=2613769 RepID=UPI0002715C70|nr:MULTISPECIES: hypothetical protein [unclassified Rhizobium]EJL52034.1 hypothetical protein PMI09_04053 [Rhizobium sp. CF122]MBB4166758.1 hypothetical protein [Rhizobium sp. BK538]TCM77486.1 hypothetical protein EV291_107129 [Rhizobium sp. BK068]
MSVEVHRLPAGGAAYIEALAAGMSLAGSVAAAVAETPAFYLSANLAGALRTDAFCSVR